MNQSHRAQPARLDRSGGHDGVPRVLANTDQERAPITFGWWAHTTGERISKYFHVETLYRLDRVVGKDGTELRPSQFWCWDEQQARAYLMARTGLLPKLPAGYRWLGPQLVEDVYCAPRVLERTFPADLLTPEMNARLARAQNIARAILRRRAVGQPA